MQQINLYMHSHSPVALVSKNGSYKCQAVRNPFIASHVFPLTEASSSQDRVEGISLCVYMRVRVESQLSWLGYLAGSLERATE